MPDNTVLYLILVAAIGIGFSLGWLASARRGSSFFGGAASSHDDVANRDDINPRVFQSLNHLLNDRQDLAVDALIDDLGFDEVTFDTYLSLGAAIRKRGEVDKAINIHQNLLARPGLKKAEHQRVELALATDYFSAGLYGRAENLLQQMIAAKGPHRAAAQQLLVSVFERESEWAKALDVVREISKSDKSKSSLAAHLCCELARAALPDDLATARQHIKHGQKFDRTVARLSLLAAEVELLAGEPKAACKALDHALELSPDLAVDLYPLYAQASLLLNDHQAYRKFLDRAITDPAAVPVVLLLEQARLVLADEGEPAAEALLLSRLPQIRSAGQLAGILSELDSNSLAAALDADLHSQFVLRLQTLLEKHQNFRCSNCGFGASSRHWRCPSCQQWGAWSAMN